MDPSWFDPTDRLITSYMYPTPGAWASISRAQPGAYPHLHKLTLGVQRTHLSASSWDLVLLQPCLGPAGQLWSSSSPPGGGTSSRSSAVVVSAAASSLPGLRSLTLEGPPANHGVGGAAGSFLRPEAVPLAGLPLSLQEVEFLRAEMPRVYASSARWLVLMAGGS